MLKMMTARGSRDATGVTGTFQKLVPKAWELAAPLLQVVLTAEMKRAAGLPPTPTDQGSEFGESRHHCGRQAITAHPCSTYGRIARAIRTTCLTWPRSWPASQRP